NSSRMDASPVNASAFGFRALGRPLVLGSVRLGVSFLVWRFLRCSCPVLRKGNMSSTGFSMNRLMFVSRKYRLHACCEPSGVVPQSMALTFPGSAFIPSTIAVEPNNLPSSILKVNLLGSSFMLTL
nr:hypothetical protein [Tanacetum cinerariifolium]